MRDDFPLFNHSIKSGKGDVKPEGIQGIQAFQGKLEYRVRYCNNNTNTNQDYPLTSLVTSTLIPFPR